MTPTMKLAWKTDGNGEKRLYQFYLNDGYELDAHEVESWGYVSSHKGQWQPVTEIS